MEHLLKNDCSDGGFALSDGGPPSSWFTARILQGLGALGWGQHGRFQEGLAWLDEAAPRGKQGWWTAEGGFCAVTPVALLAALAASGEDRRRAQWIGEEPSIRVKAQYSGEEPSRRVKNPVVK